MSGNDLLTLACGVVIGILIGMAIMGALLAGARRERDGGP